MSVLQAAKMLALPPPFVLQWERECTADALLIAAQPASEQCIGLMQCSCVLTHTTSPPPHLPPFTITIFSFLSFFLSLFLCQSFSHALSLTVLLLSRSLDHFTCASRPFSCHLSRHSSSQPVVKNEKCIPIYDLETNGQTF